MLLFRSFIFVTSFSISHSFLLINQSFKNVGHCGISDCWGVSLCPTDENFIFISLLKTYKFAFSLFHNIFCHFT